MYATRMRMEWSVVAGLALFGTCGGLGQSTAPGRPPAESQPADDESRWIRNVRQLTSVELGLDRAGEAYFSPDGKRVSFQAYPAGKTDYQIYVLNVDGTGLQMVSTGQGATTCSYWHPSGAKLMFASNHLDQRPAVMPEPVKAAVEKSGSKRYNWPFYPGMDVYEYTFATRELKPVIAHEGYDAECAYSPDGKLIVFCSDRDGDQEIYICGADGSAPRRITHAKGYDGGPFFSPDGRRIVYRSDRAGIDSGTMQIFTNNVEGTDEQAITSHDVLHWCPFWHPSGKWLIFTRADHRSGPPNYDLYLVKADGGEMHRVTSDPAFDGLPTFSADGRYLMWTSKRNGITAPQVFVAEFIGLTRTGDPPAKPLSK